MITGKIVIPSNFKDVIILKLQDYQKNYKHIWHCISEVHCIIKWNFFLAQNILLAPVKTH